MQQISLGPIAAWLHRPASRNARARVLIVHGLSEHSGRHLNTVEALTESGLEVVRFDLRGAGHSGGRRQWVERFENYVDDVSRVQNWISRELPSLPLFLLGHSLGGAIATHFAALFHPSLKGLILSAPAFKIGGAISPFKIAVGKMLVRFAPTLRIPGNGDLSAISRDPAAVEAYRTDPLSYRMNTLQQGNEILRALIEMPDRVSRIPLPTLFIHGSHDRVVRLEGSFELLQMMASKNKEMYVIPGGYHEPHNDLDKEEYFVHLNRWITKQLGSASETRTKPSQTLPKDLV